ncbi:MAG: aminoacyl-tRNA hydrolase [Bacteroidota bacterium]
MRVILGLGNPGSRYAMTRHNAGFLLCDYMAGRHKLEFRAGKGDYYFAGGTLDVEPFLLVKPVTYMNLSGIAARQITEQFGCSAEDMLVVHDDYNFEPGNMRLRRSGGDGGHNGITSLIEQLGTRDFPRMRIGVGNSFERGQMADYVLSEFTQVELQQLHELFVLTDPLLDSFITGGVTALFDSYSRFQRNS